MPLTSTVETLSRLAQLDGLIADMTLAAATPIVAAEAHVPTGTGPHFAMPLKKTARFPRHARLLRHADFERVYKQGRRHFSASLTVFYWPRPVSETPTPGLRIGFTVGRALGGAVQRNRMKRRLREAVRMTRPAQVIAADVVINPKKSLLTVDFTAVLNEVTKAFAVIEQKLSGKSNPESPQNKLAEARSRKPEAREPKPESRS